MKQITRCIGLLVCLAATAQVQSAVPIPPFTVYGKACSWNGRPLSTNDAATVIAKVNGVELGRCDPISGVYPELNYRISIPMASGAMEGYAQFGDPLTFEIYYDGQPHAVCASITNLTVGASTGSVSLNLIVGTYSSGDDLPDEYKELLLPYYEAEGYTNGLADITGNDDFDHDGFSNLKEFYAGTSPVDGSDYLKILDFRLLDSGYLSLSFLSAPRRTYTVPAAENLSSNHWKTAGFVLTTNDVFARTFYGSEEDDYTTFYMLPTNKTASFRLEMQ